MQIILQEDIANLGVIGDVVKVRDGYGRNYLIPRGFALEANHRNLRVLEHQKRLTSVKKEKDRQQAQGMSDRIAALSLTIQARAGEEDRLFGSVTNIDIEKALVAQGVTIDRRKIVLAEPIKQLGTYSIPVHLNSEVRGNITVNVVREG